MQENYLAKWLNNELTEAELSEFKKSDEYASYIRISEVSKQLKAPDFDADNAYENFKNAQDFHETKVVPLRPFKSFLRVAAAIAILLAGSYFFLNTLDQSYSTQLAERTEVQLPDNSQVILNADSQISFSEKKWTKERNVELDGEAFFKVAKGKKFTVSTASGTVSVLGTQFNVENRTDFFEVTCYEGLVSVLYNNKERKLPAGTSFLVVNGKVMDDTAIKNGQPSWVNNESSFKSIPLKYVLAEFERQFNVKVETENINDNQLFTGSFSNTAIKIALESISTPSKINYKLEGNNVLFYGENTP
ncbi:FecR family protein [Croceitalea marina]|uniref:FecR family protein n=1 Tax=Croceitalea marina TaxID=1775166 RepID=A0ABW5N1H2_9FLAO